MNATPKNGSHSKPSSSKKQSGKHVAAIPTPPDDIQKFIHNLPEEQKAQLVEQIITDTSISETFSGPLPPPDDFAKYENVLPGAADRIIAMAEKEQQIRANGDNAILANDKKRINFATLLGVGLLAIAGIAVWNGNALIALPLGLAGIFSTMSRYCLNFLTKPKK